MALFFGLSGTGKTTLSADPSAHADRRRRAWLGDDGVFNFEGGCYAKVIKLSARGRAGDLRHDRALRHGARERRDRSRDRASSTSTTTSITENTRAAYPIDFIPNALPSGIAAGRRRNIVFLTADAFGVLPPIARLTPGAGDVPLPLGLHREGGRHRAGVTEPQATFSTCFGAPFMPRHPTVYAKLLGERIASTSALLAGQHRLDRAAATASASACRSSTPARMVRRGARRHTGTVASSTDPHFGMQVPSACPDVPGNVLNPKDSWTDKKAYETAARDVAQRFEKNFQQFEGHVDSTVNKAAIRAAA